MFLRITRSQLGKHSYPAHSLIAQEVVQKMKKKCVKKRNQKEKKERKVYNEKRYLFIM